MIDILYNGLLAGLLLMWIAGTRRIYFGRAIAVLKRHIFVVSAFFWLAFVVFAVVFVTNLDYFDRIHDIDEAVETAVVSHEAGINPYEEYVIPRFKGRYIPGVDWTLGPYNYLPLDLFVYIGSYEVFGQLGSPEWFVVTNLMLSAAAFAVLRVLLKTEWIAYAPLAGIVMLFYAFDNASLTLLLMVLAMYAYLRVQWRPGVVAIFLLSLATLTKIFAAIPLVILVLFELQSQISRRKWKDVAWTAAVTAASAVAAVLVMLPFGIQNVLDSAVFFHTSEELRIGTSCGGTLLSEIALGSEYYSMISAAFVFASLIVGMKFRSLNDRILLTTMVFLLVSVKSSQAPLIVVGIFLMLRLKEISDARANSSRDSTIEPEIPGGSSAESV
ncbi:MAG: hypothetical protein WBD03_06760 [Thermoplasmata archaeon]